MNNMSSCFLEDLTIILGANNNDYGFVVDYIHILNGGSIVEISLPIAYDYGLHT